MIPNIKVKIWVSMNDRAWGGLDRFDKVTGIQSFGNNMVITLELSPTSPSNPIPLIKSIEWRHSRQNAIDPISIEVVPLPGVYDWMRILRCGDYIEVYDQDHLEWQGMVDSVSYNRTELNRSYFIKGTCLGRVFSDYCSLIYDRAIFGVATDSRTQRDDFIVNLTEAIQSTHGVTMGQEFAGAIWKTFFKAFRDIAGVLKDKSSKKLEQIDYTFSDGQTPTDKWGEDGSRFFVFGRNLMFDIPLWVNAFNSAGRPTIWSIMKEALQEPFNEMWMMNCRDDVRIPLYQGATLRENGFKLITRKSLFIPDEFDRAHYFEIPTNMIMNVTMQKTIQEVYTAYMSNATMTHLGTGASIALGGFHADYQRVKKYGFKPLEIPIKYGADKSANDVEQLNSNLDDGGEILKKMFQNNEDMLAGSMTIPYFPMRPGQVIQWKEPFASGEERIKALVDIVACRMSAEQTAMTTTIQYIRGKYVE